MVLAALARQRAPGDAGALRESQFKVLQQWQNQYRGNLLVFLPTRSAPRNSSEGAPQWVSYWTGARPDSKDPYEAGEELIAFWRRLGHQRRQDRLPPSWWSSPTARRRRCRARRPNGLTYRALQAHFGGRVLTGFGWGTTLTNDFIGCTPAARDLMKAISLVCKVSRVNGTPAVKLSDSIMRKRRVPQEKWRSIARCSAPEGEKNAPVRV
jgi:nicotinate phosphoribosyltransferase